MRIRLLHSWFFVVFFLQSLSLALKYEQMSQSHDWFQKIWHVYWKISRIKLKLNATKKLQRCSTIVIYDQDNRMYSVSFGKSWKCFWVPKLSPDYFLFITHFFFKFTHWTRRSKLKLLWRHADWVSSNLKLIAQCKGNTLNGFLPINTSHSKVISLGIVLDNKIIRSFHLNPESGWIESSKIRSFLNFRS